MAAKGVGLDLKEFDARPHPSDESGPHRAVAVFTLLEGFDPNPKEPDELDKMLEEQEKAEREELARKSREGLTSLVENLEKGDGLF